MRIAACSLAVLVTSCLCHRTPENPCHGAPRVGFPDASREENSAGCIAFRGIVDSADVRGVQHIPGILIDPEYDANFAIGVRITQVSDSSATIRAGSTLGFGIHSPFFFFGGEAQSVLGKECDFWLSWNEDGRHLETNCRTGPF